MGIAIDTAIPAVSRALQYPLCHVHCNTATNQHPCPIHCGTCVQACPRYLEVAGWDADGGVPICDTVRAGLQCQTGSLSLFLSRQSRSHLCSVRLRSGVGFIYLDGGSYDGLLACASNAPHAAVSCCGLLGWLTPAVPPAPYTCVPLVSTW
jgi:hypothetical protein